MYIVNHDIPKEPAGKRVQFCRDLKMVRTCQCKYPTVSDLYTRKGVSSNCILVAMAYGGTVNMYKGKEVSPR